MQSLFHSMITIATYLIMALQIMLMGIDYVGCLEKVSLTTQFRFERLLIVFFCGL